MRIFIHALNWTWTFGPPLLLLPKISIMQYNWAIAGMQFLVTIDKTIIFPILGSCTACLRFRQPPPEGCAAVSVLGGGAAAGESAHSAPRPSRGQRLSPAHFSSPQGNKMSWVADGNKTFSYLVKKQESPWVCVPEAPPLLESRQEGSSG